MPIDKNKEERLMIVDELLASGIRYSKTELLCEVNSRVDKEISGRTLHNDLIHIQRRLQSKYPDCYEDIGFGDRMDGKKRLFYYKKRNTSIFNQLSPYEIKQLKEILQVLESFGQLKGIEKYKNTITDISKRFKLDSEPVEKIMFFSNNEDYLGNEYIPFLYDAIVNKQTLIIEYKSFTKFEELAFTFSPHILKQYNNRWFLFGWRHDKEEGMNLALDRILDAKENHTEEFIKNNINWEDYFSSLYGVTKIKERDSEKIVLKFSDNTFPYITSKPIHKCQEVNYKNCTITLRLIINFELKQLIYSYANHVEVIEPQYLKDEIEETYLRIAGKIKKD